MENGCDFSTITFPNDRAYGAVAAAYVGAVAEKLGFDEHDRESLMKAVSETVIDIMQHAFEPGERATLDVSCERVPLGLKVTIKDRGIPFEPLPITQCGVEASVRDRPGMAPPICLVRGYVDDVEFHNLGPQGKETILIKHLKNRALSDYYGACELEPYASSEPDEPRSEDPLAIHLRAMEPSDAVEVAKCVYKAYGYTYGYEHIYFPERIVELNRSGEMFSAVAVTETNEVAGHIALVMHDSTSRIGELAMAVIKPEFRSQGIFTRLTEYVVQQARARGLIGVFGKAVTNHTYSQRVGLRIGEKDCALHVGFIPATASFKGITEKLPQRDSALVHFMYLDKPSVVPVCIPERHRDMILKLYDNIGVASKLVPCQSSDEARWEGESVVTTSGSVRMAFARIMVTRIGRTVVQVRTAVRELCLKHFEVIHLYVDLADTFAAQVTGEVEKLGFFFSGILPGVFPGDALILQYLNNVPIDYGIIGIQSEEGKELLDYVRLHDPNR